MQKIRLMRVLVLKWVQPKLNCALSGAFEHGSEYLFLELGTAAPYGCNDMTVGNLISPGCSSMNIMRLFGSCQRRRRSHGHNCNRPNLHDDVIFDVLLPHVQQQFGFHHIHNKLYKTSLFTTGNVGFERVHIKLSCEYKLIAIILDIARFRLFMRVQLSAQPSLFLRF